MVDFMTKILEEFTKQIEADSERLVTEILIERNEGKTLEERLYFVERQALNSEGDIAAIKELLSRERASLAKYKKEVNKSIEETWVSTISLVFELASATLGHTFSEDDINEVMEAATSAYDAAEETDALHFGRYVTDAVKAKVYS